MRVSIANVSVSNWWTWWCRTSGYGIKDKYRGTADIKLRLVEYLGLDIFIDGLKENDPLNADLTRSIKDRKVTKQSLAKRPIKYVLKGSQKHLRIGYDLAMNHLTMKIQGVDPVKLPPATKSEIC